MYKRISMFFMSVFFILLSFILIIPKNVQSADINALDNANLKCLNVEKFSNTKKQIICGTCDVKGSSGEIDWDACIASGKSHYCMAPMPPENGKVEFTITGKDFPANTPIYPVICNKDNFCTTGSADNDLKYFGSSKGSHLKITYESNPDGIFTSGVDGSFTAKGTLRGVAKDGKYPFFGLYFSHAFAIASSAIE